MTITMNKEQRCKRLDQFIRENRLIRKAWTGTDAQGRETACLLAALAPECAKGNVIECPSELMPQWLAELTPWIDDAPSEEAWPVIVKRYAALSHRWHVLTPDAWSRLHFTVRAISLRKAREFVSASEVGVMKVIDDVLALLGRATDGGDVNANEWAAASAAAWAASAAAEAAASAAAWAAAADQIITAILDAIELEIAKAEGNGYGVTIAQSSIPVVDVAQMLHNVEAIKGYHATGFKAEGGAA
jgi:hypothetical protein